MKKDKNLDYVKACRKKSREEEFERHGKSINYGKVEKSKKAYSRKNKYKNYEEY